MMKFLKNNGSLMFSLVGLNAICLLVWFAGPFIPLLGDKLSEGYLLRVMLIVIIVLIWGLIVVLKARKKSNSNKELLADMQEDSHISGEKYEIQSKFNQAIEQIKQKQGKDKFNIYDKPWYVIIGPPGCGKTTALENSGLQFPLNSNKFEGVSGTKNCDWWFTDKAVMIDTAGRFTTHDSQRSADYAGWHKFLAMLKEHRQVRPINGVIVAFSIRDLIDNGPSLKLEYARTVRARIEELNQQLGIQFPVYFMFTKCDLIEGFSEFFAHFETRDREQVWGETFHFKNFDDNGLKDIEEYADIYQSQIQRLQRQMLSRLNRESNDKASSAIINFPIEMAALKDDICHFLYHAFAPNHMQKNVILRGVYYTCGTLESTSVDKLSDNLASEWDLKISTNTESKHRQGFSFFLRNLLNDVVFKESELAGIDQSIIRAERRRKSVTLVCSTLMTILLSALWYFSYDENLRLMNDVRNYITQAKEHETTGTLEYPDFEKVVKELNNTQLGYLVYEESTKGAHAGLYQGVEIQQETERAYIAALTNKLLPVVTARLQEILIESVSENRIPSTYEYLKAYLMYAGLHIDADVDFDAELLRQISTTDWDEIYYSNDQLKKQLAYHHDKLLDYLADGTISFNGLSDSQIKVANLARESLRQSPLVSQIYQSTLNEINSTLDASALTFENIAGNLAYDVFESKSGKNLREVTIPFVYTKAAFVIFLERHRAVSEEYVSNNWVVGKHKTWQDIPNPRELNDQLLKMYYQNYINHWQGLLADLVFIEDKDLNRSMRAINQASAINGPIEMIIRTVASETNLTKLAPDQETLKAGTNAIGEVSSKAQRVLSTTNRIAKNLSNATGGIKLAEPVIREFQQYHRLVDDKRGTPAVQFIVEEIGRFNSYLKRPIESGFTDDAALETVKLRIEGRGNDRFGSLQRVSNGAPSELKDWVATMTRSGWTMLLSKARQELNTIWYREVYAYYEQAIANGYPVAVNSQSSIELRDFAEFFGPSGVIDTFIQGHLRPFITMNRIQWEEKPIDGQSLNIANTTLTQLFNANMITRIFFPKNSSEPSIVFTVSSEDLDNSIFSFNLQLGSKSYQHNHGPEKTVDMSWPLNIRNERSSAKFQLSNDQFVTLSDHRGPWSMFKLLDDAIMEGTETNSTYLVKFRYEGSEASFRLRVNTEFNPIGSKMLQSFKLPKEL